MAEVLARWEVHVFLREGAEPSGKATRSPDGATIAFSGRAGVNGGGIWLMAAEGTNLRRLTDEEKSDDRAPAWSPDGKWFVFSRGPITDESTNDLWKVSLDGCQRQLTRGKSYEGASVDVGEIVKRVK